MAGLAGALNAPGRIHALQDALAPRGADAATLHLDGFDGAELDLAVRSALPAIPRVVSDAGTDHARIVAGLAVDGIASVTALDAGYATRGPAGLFDGALPYAVVLADAERDCLVLARNGDGPTLYYARYREGWLAASEPAALLRSGVPADPDPQTIARFVRTGACDETRHTFLDGVWRVRSGEAVVLGADGTAESVGEPTQAGVREVAVALETAVGDGRVGVLLGPGRSGAAVLGAALARADRLRPLPVHTVVFTDLCAEAGRVPGLLVSMSLDLVRHVPHALPARGLDLDAFLSEIGEPVPDLQLYLLWAVARTLGGEVDVLVDSAAGDPGVVSRVRDRIEARYGVAVRTPMREIGQVDDGALESFVDGPLPAMAARGAAIDLARPATAAGVLLADLDAVAAAVARPRSWLDRTASIDALRRLSGGEPADADALLRAYLVERWLDTLPQSESDLEPVAAIEDELAEAPVSPVPVGSARVAPPEEIQVDGVMWSRARVRTEVFVAGDGVPAKVGWHATNALAELTVDRATREALRGPWFAILSGRALAVAQRRVCPLWDIKPGPLARYLAGLAQRPLPHLGEAWTMQVALDDCGRAGVAFPVLLAQVWPSRAARMLPEAAAALYPPRAGAVPPGDSAVVQGPIRPDRAADALVSAIRYAAPVSLVSTLAGCAVVSADEDGSRLLGFAPGPYVDGVVDAESVVAQLCADNPAGQDQEQTPLVLAYAAPRWRAADGRDRFDVRINRKSTMDTRSAGEIAPAADETTPSTGETTPSR